MAKPAFSPQVLDFDCAREADRIAGRIRELLQGFRKKGAVVALSGGIDSSATAALCVHALGKERVFGLHMPEQDSSRETLGLSRSVSEHFGFDSAEEDLTPVLESVGCYRRHDQAIRMAIPEYGPGWKSKIVLPNVVDNDAQKAPIHVTVATNIPQNPIFTHVQNVYLLNDPKDTFQRRTHRITTMYIMAGRACNM
jgi:NAD+ synthase